MAYEKINELLEQLKKSKSELETINTGISLSNEILAIFGASRSELHYGEEVLDKAFPTRKFKNQKMEQWYAKHPYMGSARVALDLFSGQTVPVESKFYKLNESANKAKISASTKIDSNWEDNELTMKPQYKIGIDFFLKSDESSLLIVLTSKGNLRVLEISDHLSNTQIEILDNVKNCFSFTGINKTTGEIEEYEPQRTIHKNLWDAFALQSVNKKFYKGVAESFEELVQYMRRNLPFGISTLESENDIKLFTTRLLGRLLFLWFLKKKNIINSELAYFDLQNYDSTEYYDLKLKDLFFGTLNTPVDQRTNQDKLTPYLNGGLFDPHPNDFSNYKVLFPINWFNNLYQHFNSFNFTTDESSPEYEQIAIDPEMLGRVFENLLATIVPETSKAANEKKNKGAFYTPREIVDFMSKQSLKYYLQGYVNNPKDDDGIEKLIDMNDADLLEKKSTGKLDFWGNRSEEVISKLIEGLDKIKILDPACGSGAYPMGMLQLMVRTFDRLSSIYDEKIKAHRPIVGSERNDVYKTKLSIIQKSLYGVDIEPMATEISRLRSWLSLIIDDKGDIEPLPNLDFNFVCANSLIYLEKFENKEISFVDLVYEESFNYIRDNYFNAHTKEEKLLIRDSFNELYLSISNDFDTSNRTQKLLSWNPFDSNNPAIFFDSKIMFNIEGFDLVIGNPPYIHFEDIKKESSEIYKPLNYKTYEARGDIYTLFYEMGINNLKENGYLCYITSNKWMRAGYGAKLRDYFVTKTQPVLLFDLGSDVFESATVDTNILTLKKAKYVFKTQSVTLSQKNRGNDLRNYLTDNTVLIEFGIGQTWIINNGIETLIKNKIESAGITFSKWPNIKINRGILTGLNEAFIISEEVRNKILNDCKSIDEYERTSKIIQPILRGRDIKKYAYNWAKIYLVSLVPSKNYDIEQFPAIKNYFNNAEWTKEVGFGFGKLKLDQTGVKYSINKKVVKSRKLTTNKWFETQDQIAYIDDFYKTKIIYPNMTKYLPFVLDNQGFLTNQKCFIITGSYLEYLTAFLNSSLFKFCYIENFPELQGGTRELSKIYFEKIKIKIPDDEVNKKCKILVNEVQSKRVSGENVDDIEREIDKILFDFYGLSKEEKETIGFMNIT